MDEDGWITEPEAIDTIVALRAIRAGDEIRVQKVLNIWIEKHINDGDVVVVAHIEDEGTTHPWTDHPVRHGPNAPTSHKARLFSDGRYVFARENIAAWRRPSGKKSSSQ